MPDYVAHIKDEEPAPEETTDERILRLTTMPFPQPKPERAQRVMYRGEQFDIEVEGNVTYFVQNGIRVGKVSTGALVQDTRINGVENGYTTKEVAGIPRMGPPPPQVLDHERSPLMDALYDGVLESQTINFRIESARGQGTATLYCWQGAKAFSMPLDANMPYAYSRAEWRRLIRAALDGRWNQLPLQLASTITAGARPCR